MVTPSARVTCPCGNTSPTGRSGNRRTCLGAQFPRLSVASCAAWPRSRASSGKREALLIREGIRIVRRLPIEREKDGTSAHERKNGRAISTFPTTPAVFPSVITWREWFSALPRPAYATTGILRGHILRDEIVKTIHRQRMLIERRRTAAVI